MSTHPKQNTPNFAPINFPLMPSSSDLRRLEAMQSRPLTWMVMAPTRLYKCTYIACLCVPPFGCETSLRFIVALEGSTRPFLFASSGSHCVAITACVFMLVSMGTPLLLVWAYFKSGSYESAYRVCLILVLSISLERENPPVSPMWTEVWQSDRGSVRGGVFPSEDITARS